MSLDHVVMVRCDAEYAPMFIELGFRAIVVSIENGRKTLVMVRS